MPILHIGSTPGLQPSSTSWVSPLSPAYQISGPHLRTLTTSRVPGSFWHAKKNPRKCTAPCAFSRFPSIIKGAGCPVCGPGGRTSGVVGTLIWRAGSTVRWWRPLGVFIGNLQWRGVGSTMAVLPLKTSDQEPGRLFHHGARSLPTNLVRSGQYPMSGGRRIVRPPSGWQRERSILGPRRKKKGKEEKP